MQENPQQFEQRKRDHITLALLPGNQSSEHNALDRVRLIHEALPEINLEEISLSALRFGQTVKTPFLVSSMTAGHQQAPLINANLMQACQMHGWAMGVGSQRRELYEAEASQEWRKLRSQYPQVDLFSNIGIAQIITTPVKQILKLTEAIEARALIIHTNPLQECIQPEGTPHFKGLWQALEAVIKESKLPVILKETGCGFSSTTLKRLNSIGIAAVDVSGLGGTHWGRIEGHRAEGDFIKQKTAQTFANWGIDTVSSVCAAQSLQPDYEIWGSGGVRNGLDAAKLIALGASTVGFAKPMLQAALESVDAVSQLMASIEYELRVALFCTGSQTLADLEGKACL